MYYTSHDRYILDTTVKEYPFYRLTMKLKSLQEHFLEKSICVAYLFVQGQAVHWVFKSMYYSTC